MNEAEFYREISELFNANKINELQNQLALGLERFGKTHDYWFFTGVTAFNEKRYHDAINALTEANKLKSDDSRVHFNLGVSCSRLELYSDSMKWFKQVLAVLPEHIPTLLMISAIFDVTGNPAACAKTCRIILNLDPQNVSAFNNLGNSCKNSGMPAEAAEAYRMALKLNPTIESIRSNMLFSLNYATTDPIELRREHEEIASIWDKPSFVHSPDKNESRKIRIGFVSPDFCSHSVAYFLTGLYSCLDREKFFLVSYANVEFPEKLTKWFTEKSDLWRDVNFISKKELAHQIFEDKIDILIDLAGHTGGSNLIAFGMNPAPIQVTWLGYPCTTGMKSIHYRITDELADPIGVESHYTEQLIRLPHFLNYSHRSDIPDCDFTASEKRDYILFGSFNNIAKLSPETIILWGKVLNAVSHSKLLIKHKYFNDPAIQELFLKRFAEAGVFQDRLIFKAFNFTDHGHLEEYHQIDIALDSWPYNGTTTTFEAMVMGVPTLTMTGPVHASRVGSSIMSAVGLSEYVTKTPEKFAESAYQLTRDKSALLATKKGLRARFYQSPLADAKGFSRSFEQAMTTLWKDYCEHNR